MTKTEDYGVQVYTYTTMDEMMQHVATMNTAGYDLVNISTVGLKATYRKDV